MVPKQVVPDRRGLVEIGKIKENLVTEVAFDCADLGDGSGAYAVVFQRPKDAAPYPVAFRAEWPSIVWVVKAADTAKPGTGKVEIRWYGDGDQVGKSKTYMVRITDGLPDPTEAPEAWEGFMGQVARNAQAAQTAAGEAKASADGAAASAGIAQGAAAEAGNLARAAREAANAAASAASAASRAQAGAETAGQNARAAAEAAKTARSGAEAAKLSAAESATGAAGSAETAAQAAQKGENLYNQVKADLAAGKLKGEKGDTGPEGPAGKDAPQIDDGTISRDNPWSSKKIVETLCPPIAETGNPVVCYPVAGYPLGVVASWEPTQAGEGKPYPAGGGVNQWKWQKDVVFDTAVYPFQLAIADFPAELVGVPITMYADYESGSTSGATSAVHFYKGSSRVGVCVLGKEATLSDVPTLAFFYAGTGDGSKGAYFKDIMLVKGNTAPTSYAPYENIRPISGRDSVGVERCGENLVDTSRVAENQGCTIDGSVVHIVDTSGWGASYILFAGKYPSGTYTARIDVDRETHGRFILRGYDAAGNALSSGILSDMLGYGTSYNTYYKATVLYPYNPISKTKTITFTTKDAAFFSIGIAGGIAPGETTADVQNFMLVPGSILPAEYTPYQGDTLDLQLPRTVCGGKVDAVMGAGNEEWGLATFDGSEAWTIGGLAADKRDWYYVSPKIAGAINGPPKSGNEICSHYPHYDVANNNTNKGCALVWGAFRVRWGDIIPENTDAWKSYLAAQAAAGTPVQIAYKLATPAPFTATGAQPIMPLEGETNTIMTDADSVTVTGRADPAHAIAALQAQLATATQQLEDTQAAVVDTTAMAVDYIYEQDSEIFGGEDDDDQTDAMPT